MNYRPIFNRDVKLQVSPKGGQPALLRMTYLAIFALALAATSLLWVSNPEPVGAKIQAPLEITTRIRQQPPVIAEVVPATRTAVLAIPEKTSQVAMLTKAEKHTAAESITKTAPESDWHSVTVKNGDSLAAIFSRLGIKPQQLHAIMEQGGAANNLKKIYPGQTLRVQTNSQKDLLALIYPIDKVSTLEVNRYGDKFTVSTIHRIPDLRIRNASVEINNSLFLDAQNADLSDHLIMDLAGIFAWDVDFALDLRKGDQFTLLYEVSYLDGENIGGEKILAAEFINRGKKYHAIRYTDKEGKTDFYSLAGKSMRKTFLRTPVEFSRISSRFSLGRKHPILNRIRAHKGVDYAAARGTPIKATGNGKIIFRGKKGGYGNTIIIQHGTRYSTLYAHMSKFRGGLRKGSRVTQGQTIGYVGSTGLATGPHLHYEFRVDGTHRDPLKVKLPGAKPLDKKYLADFTLKADALVAQLNLIRNVQIASH